MRGDSVSIAGSLELIHYSHVVAASGLSEGESPGLKIASLLEALTESNLLIFESVQAVFPMVKVLRPEGHPPFASKYGLHHCRDGVCTTLKLMVISSFKRVVRKRFEIIRFKVESDQPAVVIWEITHLWVKLSNSGNSLKVLIPNCSRKAISGRGNYSCMVISQNITWRSLLFVLIKFVKGGSFVVEREMGYRGSKLIAGLHYCTKCNSVLVKEQRVYGSFSIKPMLLRCTLTG